MSTITSRSTSKKNASSSIGRVAVSKTVGWGFESLLACLIKDEGRRMKKVVNKLLPNKLLPSAFFLHTFLR